MPAARQTASVPPTVVAPSAPWTTQAARSRGPSLRAVAAVERARARRPSSPTRTSPSSTPIVAGTRAGARTRAPSLADDRTPSPAREAVRDQRRLERDDAAPALKRLATSSRRLRITASPRAVATQRAAASSRRAPGPPTRKPAASASPAPVESTTARHVPAASTASSPSTSKPRGAALDDPASRPTRRRARRHSRSFAKTTSGASAPSASRNRSRRARGSGVQADEVDAHARAGPARQRGRARAARVDRRRAAASSRRGAARRTSNQRGSSRPARAPARRRGRRPSSARRPARRARRRRRSRPPRRPDDLDAARRRARPRATRLQRPSPRSATTRASPPSAAAHAATFAAWPPARDRVSRRVVARGERRVEADDDVEQQVAERAHEHRYDRRMDGERETRPARLLRVGGLARRVRGARGRPAPAAASRRAQTPRASPRSRTRPASRRRRARAASASGLSRRDCAVQDREQVHVGVAEVQRAPDRAARASRLRVALACPRRLPRADDEERPEGRGLELGRRPREHERDRQPRREVRRVARVEHPDAAAERLRRCASAHTRASFVSARGTTSSRERAVLLPRPRKSGS